MKVAALYDIHGNVPALNAVLEELETVQPDLILIGGDTVFGPMPAQTLAALDRFGERVRHIYGNGDRDVVQAFDGHSSSLDLSPAGRKEADWVAGQLTREQRDFLATLPAQIEVTIEGLGRIVFCHATVRNDLEIFTPKSPVERVQTFFAGVEQDIVVCGHTHIQFEMSVNSVRIVNAGSVGMPYADQHGAYWLLLDSQGYEFKRTDYDREAAAEVIKSCGSPDAQNFVNDYVLNLPSTAESLVAIEKLALTYNKW